MPATAASRWRQGDRDPDARRAHADDTRLWRRARSAARLPAEQRAEFLVLLEAGEALPEVCDRFQLTHQAVHGRAEWDTAWDADLDAALMVGRDPDLAHGSESAYRHSRCRCGECRAGRAERAARVRDQRRAERREQAEREARRRKPPLRAPTGAEVERVRALPVGPEWAAAVRELIADRVTRTALAEALGMGQATLWRRLKAHPGSARRTYR